MDVERKHQPADDENCHGMMGKIGFERMEKEEQDLGHIQHTNGLAGFEAGESARHGMNE